MARGKGKRQAQLVVEVACLTLLHAMPPTHTAHAHTIVAYWADILSKQQKKSPVSTPGDISSTSPCFYIVELGSGSGRLSFLLLHALQRRLAQLKLDVQWRLVMTGNERDVPKLHLHVKWL